MYMATKTISIDLDAYERLRRARARGNESFSQVIKRARWGERSSTAAALLETLEHMPRLDRATLARLDRAQRDDSPPEDPWTR
jgi:predicted CopG family antitoxin